MFMASYKRLSRKIEKLLAQTNHVVVVVIIIIIIIIGVIIVDAKGFINSHFFLLFFSFHIFAKELTTVDLSPPPLSLLQPLLFD